MTAVEPVKALRDAGLRLHGRDSIEWVDDRLPELTTLWRARHRFDLVVVNAVWQHLDDGERARSVNELAAVMLAVSRLVLSLRHGPGAPLRPVHPASTDAAIVLFERLVFG